MTDIKEKMNRMDRANYNRLQASITPTQNKINKEKAKLQTIVTEATNKIKAWEEEIVDFKALAASIEDKYKKEGVTATVVTEETVNEALDYEVTAAPIVDDIPSFVAGEEEKHSVPFI